MVDSSIGGRSVKSVTASETGREKLSDLSSSGRPVATIILEMLQRADAIFRGDRHITTRQLAFSLSISKGSVTHFVRDLGYSKASAR
jgi:DNA-binding MurR/RpiR family transcriptional regulator